MNFDPTDNGAEFDGATDDAPAIRESVDEASAAGGGTVTLPAGHIRIGSPIVLRNGVHLRGQGPSTAITCTTPAAFTLPDSGTRPDWYGISDLLVAGGGIHLDPRRLTGGHRLGWPRVTIENVTIIDAAEDAVTLASGIIECRLINVVSLRARRIGFRIDGSDNFLIGCTAAAGPTDKWMGFLIGGGNSKLSTCKSYGNGGSGFWLAGAGRHMLSACEAQDNKLDGFGVGSDWNTLSACLADSNGLYGFDVFGHNNSLTAVAAMHGGGGSRQVTKAGFRLPGVRNIVAGNSNCPATVVDDSGQNRRTIYAQGAEHVID